MRLEIELRCILFPFIILEKFLQLDWKGTHLYTLVRSHTCQCMSVKKTIHEVEGIVSRAQRQDCFKAQIWGRVPTMSAALKVPKNTVASIILKWKQFGTTKTLPKDGRQAKLSNRGRTALVREVTKNTMVTLTEL
jgi:hypothetical protein